MVDEEIKNPEPEAEAAPEPMLAEAMTEAKSSRLNRWKNWYLDRKKWAIPLTILLLILVLAILPWTRYPIAGLALKKDFSLQVMDATSHRPVSQAQVSLGSNSAETDGAGKAVLKNISVGRHRFSVSKKYYQDTQFSAVVPILSEKKSPTVDFQATGRQTKVIITDLVSKRPLADAQIKALEATAKTDKDGVALVVLPVGTTGEKATVSLSGYNDATVALKVSDTDIAENPISLTPAGKLYFLSKLSGKIDVVKTNLDGSNRQIVLAGTGSEDDQNTVLLASRDWKYLALLSRRAGSSATLYLIDTSDDSTKTMDEGSANFNLVGWSGHKFVYEVTRDQINDWQTGKQALKSYNADSKSIVLLDQTVGSGTGQYDYIRENFGEEFGLPNEEIVYAKNWISDS